MLALNDLYGFLLRIGKGSQSTYPECTGLIITAPDVDTYFPMLPLLSEGKIVRHLDRNGIPCLSARGGING